MAQFHLSTSSASHLESAVAAGSAESSVDFVRLAIAVGLATESRVPLPSSVAFQDLLAIDPARVFVVIAAARDLLAATDEGIAATLEQYCEGGVRELRRRAADGPLDPYALLQDLVHDNRP